MIILASGSPRRSEILSREGIQFQVEIPNTLEILNEELSIPEQAMEIAKEKAMAVYENHPGKTVLAADTIVVYEQSVFGKPKSKQNAFEMLTALRGKTHQVITAFCIVKDDQVLSDYDVTDVTFKAVSKKMINEYIATGEPMDRAGAYAIQEKGAFLVDSYSGDYDTVVGLPIKKIKRYL